MAQFRRKTFKIQAVQWTGSNLDEVKEFVGDKGPVVFHEATGRTEAVIAIGNPWIGNFWVLHEGDYVVQRADGSLFSEDKYDFDMKYEPEEVPSED